MKAIGPVVMASAAFLARTTALQSPFRIRTPQSLQTNAFQDSIPTFFPSSIKERPVEEKIRPEASSLNGNNLSPFLQEMVDEQRELQMNVGKAIDVLKQDYPNFLKSRPGKCSDFVCVCCITR